MGYQNAKNKAANNTKPPETHSEETGQEAAFQFDDQFEEFDTAIANQIVNLRGAKIMQKVLTRISAGDIGTIAPQMLKAFEQGAKTSLGEEVKLLEEWHKKPLRALPPADK
ncbi:MAG: hypothetical protein RMY36_032435 [Nostoc sp. SerVER01]|nr:hypothetical protein [Nostoc sp. SerVER01]